MTHDTDLLARVDTMKAEVRFYRIMVDHPFHGWIPVGPFYRDKTVARGWISFVKSAWHGLPCRTVHVASLLTLAPQ